MKKLIFLCFVFGSTVTIAQNDKNYVDGLVSEFTKSLENRGIDAYFYLNKYCDGTTEMFKLSDGNMCVSKGTYYEVYVFWNEGNQSMIKKIDNCGLYFSLPLTTSKPLNFVKNNTRQLENGKVKNYKVKTPENVPAKSAKVHSCHRVFMFTIEDESFGQTYNLYDLTNESKYENLNFEHNYNLEIVALEKVIDSVILEVESNFRRQF